MAKSPVAELRDQVHDLAVQPSAALERVATQTRDIEQLSNQVEGYRSEASRLREEFVAVRQENALLRQRLDDHIAQYREWDRRRWGLIVLLIGTVLSLASGLIVTLAQKNP